MVGGRYVLLAAAASDDRYVSSVNFGGRGIGCKFATPILPGVVLCEMGHNQRDQWQLHADGYRDRRRGQQHYLRCCHGYCE